MIQTSGTATDIAKNAATTPPRDLTMEYAGGLVKHLGLSMYRGAVLAIAELIANAWDADASREARLLS